MEPIKDKKCIAIDVVYALTNKKEFYLFMKSFSKHNTFGHLENVIRSYAHRDMNLRKYRLAGALLREIAVLVLRYYEEEMNWDASDFIDIKDIKDIKEINLNKEKVNTMNDINFETKYYVLGTDVNNMSNDQLFDAIRTIEGKIKSLENIYTTSKAVTITIKEYEKDIKKIVKLLDKRF